MVLPEGVAETIGFDSLRDVLIHELRARCSVRRLGRTAAAPGLRALFGRIRWFITRAVSSRGLAKRFAIITCCALAARADTPVRCWHLPNTVKA